MERVNKILNHSEYRTCLQKIQELEAARQFCGHDMAHFLDVARLAYIFNLEEGLQIDKEVIYAVALLHDIGRHLEYLEGIAHNESSVLIAAGILPECGYTKGEIEVILDAIHAHRDAKVRHESSLCGIIYRADKMSRSCFGCAAEKACHWDAEKKNLQIVY